MTPKNQSLMFQSSLQYSNASLDAFIDKGLGPSEGRPSSKKFRSNEHSMVGGLGGEEDYFVIVEGKAMKPPASGTASQP